jgi:hypothetical protein
MKTFRFCLCLLAVSVMMLVVSNAAADSKIIGTAIGHGTIPHGLYEGSPFTVSYRM